MLPKLYNGRNRSFFFATFEKTHARRTDVDRLPHAADARVPERRLLASLRCRLHGRCPLGHGRRDRRARPADPLRPDLRPAHDARRRRPRDARSLPEQPDSARDVGRRGAQHPRAGAVGHAGARSPVQQPAGARDLLSGVRPEHVRDEIRPGASTTAHKASFYVNREWRDAEQLAGRPLRPAARIADQSVPAAEHAELDDQGVRELGDQRSAAAPLRVRLQPVRRTRTAASISTQGWPSKIGLTNQPDTTFPRFAFGGDGDSGQLWAITDRLSAARSYEGSTIVQDDLTFIIGQAQHQDRLRGALLLRRQRNRRRDGHLQLQLGADEPARDSISRPGTPTRASCSARCRPRAGRCRRSTPTTTSTTTTSTCRTTSRSRPSSRSTWAALADRAGLVREERLRHQPRSDAAQHRGGQSAGRAAVRRPGRPEDASSTRTTAQLQPRLGVAYAVSPKMALSGGYSLSNRAGDRPTATARTSSASNSTGYNAQHLESPAPPGRRRTRRIRSCS